MGVMPGSRQAAKARTWRLCGTAGTGYARASG